MKQLLFDIFFHQLQLRLLPGRSGGLQHLVNCKRKWRGSGTSWDELVEMSITSAAQQGQGRGRGGGQEGGRGRGRGEDELGRAGRNVNYICCCTTHKACKHGDNKSLEKGI